LAFWAILNFAFSAITVNIVPTQEKNTMLPKYGILIKSHEHQKDFRAKPHAHKVQSMVYIISGQGTCRLKNLTLKLKANTIVLIPANVQHQLIDEPGHPMTVFVVYFSEKVCSEIMPVWAKITKTMQSVEPSPYLARDFRRWLREMVFEQNSKPPYYEAALKILLTTMLLRIARQIAKPKQQTMQVIGEASSDRVKVVLEYVTSYYYRPQSLPEAAKSAKLSQRRFSSIVRKITGMSFVEYIQGIRVQKATELLKSTNMPITAIAFEVGFEDLSTFYRSFHKLHKASPAKFRNPSV
jgi:AraC-like DNA-binding protein/mannose-6-phosphate isomerase-like protein (cupin superfamily)